MKDEKLVLMKANKQLESVKSEILGMVGYMKKSNLEYKEKVRELEKQVLDLTHAGT